MPINIQQALVNAQNAAELRQICPFNAFEYDGQTLSISAACRMCKLCVTRGPAGVVTWQDEPEPLQAVDKAAWRGVAVFAEKRGESVHPVTLELLGKAKELAGVTGHPVYVVAVGEGMQGVSRELLHYGADKVYLYDDPCFEPFNVAPYANAFYDFIEAVKPSSVLVGATNIGRSLAPKVAARAGAGLTADCTVLEMRENTDLVQIRPAFGGNIMAQIVTPNARPQFCTVRYKIFSAPERMETAVGEVVLMPVTGAMRQSRTQVLEVVKKPAEVDLSEAEVIVAVGRGLKSAADLPMIQELAGLLGAQLAGTRAVIEAGWLDPKQQIGLSGRTVKPKLIVTVGISGAVQFAAGMKGADYIVAINSDEHATIFDIAHCGIVGDLYEVLPRLIAGIKEERYV